MLDLDSPESKKIIEACFLLEEIGGSYKEIVALEGKAQEVVFGRNRVKLGRLAILAESLLAPNQLEAADTNIKLLYKALTGQVSITEQDFKKIESLLSQLSNESFGCWCI